MSFGTYSYVSFYIWPENKILRASCVKKSNHLFNFQFFLEIYLFIFQLNASLWKIYQKLLFTLTQNMIWNLRHLTYAYGIPPKHQLVSINLLKPQT